MKQYLELLNDIRLYGVDKSDRTGVGTRSVFGRQLRFDLANGFPLVTTKKMFMRGVIVELLWMISGSTNVKVLQEQGVHIWDEWADPETGELGPVYGKQWRDWNNIDQLLDVQERIKTHPDCRRLIVNSWNVSDVPRMRLPPCHMFYQFYVANGRLSCQMYQRSADVFLGVPFNIAQYALLTMMVAQVTGLEPGEFVHTFGDVHIYQTHRDQVIEQLQRKPFPLPVMVITGGKSNITEYTVADFELHNYRRHPSIPAPVAV